MTDLVPLWTGPPSSCIRCGACMEVCPLYQRLGREPVVARGKLSLLQALESGELSASRHFQEILECCLLCGACTEKCVAQIQIPELIKKGRARVRSLHGAHWSPALALVHLTRQSPHLIPALAEAAPLINRMKNWLGEPSGWFYRLWPGVAGPLGQLPPLARRPFLATVPKLIPGAGPLKIAFFVGCGLQAWFPSAGHAFLKLCQQEEVAVVIPPTQGCCGLLAECAGERQVALELGRRLLAQFGALEVDYIVSTCASCTYQLKHLGQLFQDTPLAIEASRFSSRVREASEFLVHILGLTHYPFSPAQPSRPIIFHDPCHLHRGQAISQEPRDLLMAVPGLELVEPPGGKSCCGQGGLFGLCYPDLSKTIGQELMQVYQQTGAAEVVSACSGCLMQLISLAPQQVPVRHFLEVLADSC
ncbi:MAG: (Fe-S)-binding protein [Deltaproteobacteria bacterium]|nr:(Fe-S)-binding protein [Deltaproteobacteria bacterium]